MNRGKCFKIILTLVSLSLFATQGLAQGPSYQTRKQTVDNFLSAWLVRKDKTDAMKFFHRRALSSNDVLSVPCFGDYVSFEDRHNRKAVKRGVMSFLEESSKRIKGTFLNDILFLTSEDVPELSQQAAKAYQRRVLNSPQQDKYYLISYKSFVRSLANKDENKYFARRYKLNTAFLSIVQYRVLNEDERYGDDVFSILLWVRNKGL